jgi:hypothetical protein
VIEKSLAALPRRKTDNAVIIQAQDDDLGKAKVFKLNAKPSDPVILERYALTLAAIWPIIILSTGMAVTSDSIASCALGAVYRSATRHPHHQSNPPRIFTSLQGRCLKFRDKFRLMLSMEKINYDFK